MSPAGRVRIAFAGLATTVAVAAGPARAQQAGPLFKSDIVRLLTTDSYQADEVLQIVRMNCVGFEPSERDRQDIRRFPAGETILEAVDACRGGNAAAGYRNGVPVASQARVGRDLVERPAAPRVDEVRLAALPVEAAPVLVAPRLELQAPRDTLPGVVAETPPRLLNWDRVTRQILDEYRPDVRHPGEVVLKIHVDAEGIPGDAAVERSSGDPALVAAALAAVPVMRFSPASSRDRRVESWAYLPIRFNSR